MATSTPAHVPRIQSLAAEIAATLVGRVELAESAVREESVVPAGSAAQVELEELAGSAVLAVPVA